MKILNWNYVAACGACLFLLSMSARAELLTFDTLSETVPSGYGNLEWQNFFPLNGESETQSGYKVGVVSKNNVVFNGDGTPASIFVTSGSFKPVMAFMTAAWNDNLKLNVKGYLRGKLVFYHNYTLSATRRTVVVFGTRVDELDFTTSGGTHHPGYNTGSGEHFAMDDLLVQP